MTQDCPTVFNISNQAIGFKNHPIFSNLSLMIKQGEKVAIVGTSGSGKSTLLNYLYQCRSDDVAYCPQKSMLVDTLSVYHNIYMGILNQHGFFYNVINLIRPFPVHKTQIEQLTRRLGLTGLLFKSLDKLSGGQQQRCAIGRALYQQLPIFIGDEPFSGLDPKQSVELLKAIKDQHQTVVVALHNKEMALNQFDRIIGIKDGAIAFDTPATEVSSEQLDLIYHRIEHSE